MTIFNMLGALLLTGGLSLPAEARMCMIDLPPVDGKNIAFYVLTTDDKSKTVERSLHLRTGQFTVRWNMDRGLRRKESMSWFDAWMPIGRETAYPVEMSLRQGDREIAIMKAWPSRDKLQADFAWFMSISVPNIFGASDLTARLTDANGLHLSQSSSFKLPNWSWLEREAKSAARAANILRVKKRCYPTLNI